MLLATDHKRRTVFHVAEKHYKLQILQKILKREKEELTT